MLLTDEDKINEIKRIEERSLFFLKAFGIFWFTILFFIMRKIFESEKNEWINTLINNSKSIFSLATIEGILSTIGFWILLILIPITLILLSKNSITNLYEPNNKRNWLIELINKKYGQINRGIRYGYMVSFLLIIYMAHLFVLSNTKIQEFYIFLSGIIIYFMLFIFLVYAPLASIFDRKLDLDFLFWVRNRITEIITLLFIISFLILKYIPLFSTFFQQYLIRSYFTIFIIIFLFNLFRFMVFDFDIIISPFYLFFSGIYDFLFKE